MQKRDNKSVKKNVRRCKNINLSPKHQPWRIFLCGWSQRFGIRDTCTPRGGFVCGWQLRCRDRRTADLMKSNWNPSWRRKKKKKKWAKYTVCCEIWTQSKGKNKIKQAARRMSIERDEIVKRRVIPEDIDGWKYSTWLNFTVCPLGWIREINEVMDGQRHFMK